MSTALAGCVALVTGASRGIGRASALALAAQGAHCVLLARSQGGLEETDDLVRRAGGSTTLLPLDLADGDAIDRIGPTLAARFGRLDILVHAAAVLGTLTPVGHAAARDWDETMAVNLTAGWRLIRTVSPLLEAAPRACAVLLTDPVAASPRPYWGMLAASKAGLAALVECWRQETAATGRLHVTMLDPGPAATRMRARAMPGEDPADLPPPEHAGARIALLCRDALRTNG